MRTTNLLMRTTDPMETTITTKHYYENEPALQGALLMQMTDYAIRWTMEVLDDLDTTNHAFPRMLFAMLSDPHVKSLRWTPGGEGFQTSFEHLKKDLGKYLIRDVSTLNLVPAFFNLLAKYKFTRTTYGNSWMWEHSSFKRQEPEKMVAFNKQNGYCALCFPLKPPTEVEVGSVRDPPQDTSADTSADVEGPRRLRQRT